MKRHVLILLVFAIGICASAQRHVKNKRWGETTMDISHTIVGTDKAMSGLDLPQAFTGKGVVVGVSDIGFDFSHPNFDKTNIIAFWDILSRDTVGFQNRLITGRDYDASELHTVQHSYDGREFGHGTHVMGIAVGGNNTYRGVAPDADVVVVGTVLGNNSSMLDSLQRVKLSSVDHSLAQYQYIFEQAERLGKPCVINVSSGSRQSFGDNFPECNRQMSELCGPGRIIVASAGNDGRRACTLHKEAGRTVGTRTYILNSTFCYHFLQKSGDVTCRYFYSTDEGRTKHPLPEELYERIDTISDYDGTPVEYHIFQHEKMGYMGAWLYVQLSGEGCATLFTQGTTMLNSGTDDGWNDATADYSIFFPGAYDDVICVGYMVHRNQMTNHEGKLIDITDHDGKVGLSNLNSSEGPRLDGTVKPDVTAPGTLIGSSYNSFFCEAHPNELNTAKTLVEKDGRVYPFGMYSGTSMSTPLVTGVIALWLQANPNLGPQDIKDIIARTSRHPDPTLAYPNPVYGYGEIDAYAGLLDILGLSSIDGVSGEHIRDVNISMQDGTLVLNTDDQSGAVIIYNMAGTMVHRQNFEMPVVRINMSHLPHGVYAVQINTDKKKGSTLIRL